MKDLAIALLSLSSSFLSQIPPQEKTKAGKKMPRVRLPYQKIEDSRRRQATFLKRKNGVIKKCMELSVMCGCEIALVVFDLHGKPLQYVSNGDIDDTLKKFVDYDKKVDEYYTNEDVRVLGTCSAMFNMRSDTCTAIASMSTSA